jgi:hypothetical protein
VPHPVVADGARVLYWRGSTTPRDMSLRPIRIRRVELLLKDGDAAVDAALAATGDVETRAIAADTTAAALAPGHSVAADGAMAVAESMPLLHCAVFVRRPHFPLLPVAHDAVLAPLLKLSAAAPAPRVSAAPAVEAVDVVVAVYPAAAGVTSSPVREAEKSDNKPPPPPPVRKMVAKGKKKRSQSSSDDDSDDDW